MKSYKVRYSVHGINGVAEVIIRASSSSAAREMVINQNGGRGKVTIYDVSEVR